MIVFKYVSLLDKYYIVPLVMKGNTYLLLYNSCQNRPAFSLCLRMVT